MTRRQRPRPSVAVASAVLVAASLAVAAALVCRLRPREARATTRFRIVTPRGSVTGSALSTYSVDRLALNFTGAGVLTGGTGAYRGIRSGPLRFDAIHSITGRREVIAFTGRATLPADRRSQR